MRHQRFDQASHAALGVAGTIVELTTEDVAPAERLDYWREAVLRRMVPIKALAEDRPFRGRLRRIIVSDGELIEHAPDAVVAVRSPQHCRADDEVTIDLMMDCGNAHLDHGAERPVRPGDLCIMDYAQPIEVVRSRHRAVGIILSRSRVRDALGEDLSGPDGACRRAAWGRCCNPTCGSRSTRLRGSAPRSGLRRSVPPSTWRSRRWSRIALTTPPWRSIPTRSTARPAH